MKKIVGITVLIAASSIGCRDPRTVLEQLMESRGFADELLLQFTKTVEAGNRAVMADTEDAAAAATKEVDAATASVQRDTHALGELLGQLRYADEGHLLADFSERFDAFESLDRHVLDLAALDTNLKAQRLSFGPAQEAVDGMRDALARVTAASPGDWHVQALADAALSSAREIQTLEAPHIAEARDDAMTRLEQRMNRAQAAARAALASLASSVKPAARGSAADATTSFDQFLSVDAEILKFSRQNSNVQLLALALGQKRTLAASCEETLRALQSALGRRTVGATR